MPRQSRVHPNWRVVVALAVLSVAALLFFWPQDIWRSFRSAPKASAMYIKSTECPLVEQPVCTCVDKCGETRAQLPASAPNHTTTSRGSFKDVCPDEDKFTQLMAKHFAFWPDGFITRQLMEETYVNATENWIDIRTQIIDGKVYVNWHPKGWHYSTRNHAMLVLIRRAVDAFADIPDAAIPDVDFMWQTADVCHFYKAGTDQVFTPKTWLAPIWSVCDSPVAQSVPMPDFGFYNWDENGADEERGMEWTTLRDKIVESAATRPYKERIKKGLFRGHWQTAERDQAKPFLEPHRDLLDLGLDGTARKTSVREYSNWAVQIYMAGNGYSGRLRYLLATGSPVVIYQGTQRGLMREYFVDLMVPWVHYVPAWHPAQMVHVIRYLLEHPEVAEQIGKNAQQFAIHELSADKISCYFHYLWRAYAKKQHPDKIQRMKNSVVLRRTPQEVYDQASLLRTIQHYLQDGKKLQPAFFPAQDDYFPPFPPEMIDHTAPTEVKP